MWRSSRNMLRFLGLLIGLVSLAGPSWAQTPSIVYPQAGQQVRGQIVVRFAGIPDGGYAMIRVDGELVQATAENTYTLNTFNYPDGTRRVSITVIGPSGKTVGTAETSFEIANKTVDTAAPGVTLLHWNQDDIYDNNNVTRYRVFAESIASISGGAEGGTTAGGGGAEGGAADTGGISFLPAPLDWQVTALIRKRMRDVGMIDNSANIQYVVHRAQQRQRLGAGTGSGEGGGEGGEGGGGTAAPDPALTALIEKYKNNPPTEPILGPWASIWDPAPETGEYRVDMTTQTGKKIQAHNRKARALGLVDLLPTFPESEVRPGSTWQSEMTFLGELSERDGIRVSTPMTFTDFEDVRTPAGETIRAAKLEARFRLPDNRAMAIATNLAPKIGGAGTEGAGAATGAATGAGGAAEPPPITIARTTISRVLWFDIAGRRVVRTEDSVNNYFEIEATDAGAGGAAAMGGVGADGQAVEPPEPTRVNYNLRAVLWLDDTIPPPTDEFTAGRGTAHSRDSVQDPDVSRITNDR